MTGEKKTITMDQLRAVRKGTPKTLVFHRSNELRAAYRQAMRLRPKLREEGIEISVHISDVSETITIIRQK